MKLDVFRISLNRKTGEQLGKEHIGRTQIDQRLVAEASVALLTGMTLDETCKALTKAFKESCKGGEVSGQPSCEALGGRRAAMNMTCTRCGKEWNVSILKTTPPSVYICPHCTSKERRERDAQLCMHQLRSIPRPGREVRLSRKAAK